MRIARSSLFCLMREGRVTLQIPQYALIAGTEDQDDVDFIECEEDWFINSSTEEGRPSIGKEGGFTFLSKKGWDALQSEIEKEFVPRGRVPGTLEDLKQHAEMVFANRKIASEKYCANLEKKLKAMQDIIQNQLF